MTHTDCTDGASRDTPRLERARVFELIRKPAPGNSPAHVKEWRDLGPGLPGGLEAWTGFPALIRWHF